MNDGIKNTVRTSETTLHVIDAVMSIERPRIKDVSEQLDISKSTALRHLTTLEKFDYVIKEEGTYRLGSKFLDYAGILRNNRVGYELAEKYVDELVNETNERVQFMIKERGHRVILFRRTRGDTIRTTSKIGKKGPLHDTAGGKAILADLSDSEIESVIDDYGLPAQTEHTIVDEDELFAEIEEIREQGFATSHQEATIGYNAVGSTVHDDNGEVLGALSVAGPKNRMKGARFNEELPELVMNMIEELELKIEFLNSEDGTESTRNIATDR